MRRAKTPHNFHAPWTGSAARQRGAAEYSRPGGPAFCIGCPAFEQGVADSTLVGLKEPDELLALRAYRWQEANGTTIEPEAGLKGIWDFEDGGTYGLDGTLITPHDLRAEVDAGVRLRLPDGMTFAITGSYDGIGISDYSAYSGKLQMTETLP